MNQWWQFFRVCFLKAARFLNLNAIIIQNVYVVSSVQTKSEWTILSAIYLRIIATIK